MTEHNVGDIGVPSDEKLLIFLLDVRYSQNQYLLTKQPAFKA